MVSSPPPDGLRRGDRDWMRVLRPLVLLALFVAVIRGLPADSRPEPPETNCHFPTPNSADAPTLERCLQSHPDDVELMMDLGHAHEQAEQWDRAEAIYRRALEADPDDGDAHVRLGELLLRRGDAAGAIREGAAALKIQPGRAAVLDLLERARNASSGTAR